MSTTLPADPTGRQVHLATADGRVTAQIAQVGASLRGLRVTGIDLVPPYPAGTMTPAASGVVLVPWPNRVRDGAWTQRGASHRLPITDIPTGTASHGLLRFASYDIVDESADAVSLSAPVVPRSGYPFHLDTTVTYAVTASGIEVTHRVTNIGADDAPVALGTHPYVCLGDVATADLTLTVPGATRFVLDERLLPVDEVAVTPDVDLRAGARLGDVTLNYAYGSLGRSADGRVRTTLVAADGRSVELWQGPGFDYVQVYTMDAYPGQALAVAVEPMTAPPDALNSGQGLRWLASGESWELRWGIASSLSL
ncbi:galactose mutarotase [Microbacterium sp. Root61]|uniref:aldose 1-epimerase family protein n=1 Tax=Microbacterium sp. Root61 TaxID=1736570 RepID=UPI0006F2F21E|nr:aldose 1-epimerase family protein [Microbacterium sp. Root61]KRA25067.1 galactose mutarotase [Microbacterium sp. Root61]